MLASPLDTPAAAMELAVTYRGEETIEQVVAADTKTFGENSFSSAGTIAGKTAFQWNLGSASNTGLDVTTIFNGKKNYTYQLHEVITKGTKTIASESQISAFQKQLTSMKNSLIVD